MYGGSGGGLAIELGAIRIIDTANVVVENVTVTGNNAGWMQLRLALDHSRYWNHEFMFSVDTDGVGGGIFIGATLPADSEAGFIRAANVTVSLTAVRAVANSACELFSRGLSLCLVFWLS